MEALFETILLISAFCLGLRAISSKGKLLYFLRYPYDLLVDELTNQEHGWQVYYKTSKSAYKKLLSSFKKYGEMDFTDYKRLKKEYYLCRRYYFTYSFLKYLLTPIIGCVTCMASVFGILIYTYYFYANFNFIEMTICCISAAFINATLWALYELIESKITKK